MVTHDNKETDYIAVRCEFFNEKDEQKFIQLLATKKVIGLSSYQTFPAPIRNPHQIDRPGTLKDEERFIVRYGHLVVLWCHCFKWPVQYIPQSIPYLLLSETDQYEHLSTLYAFPEVPKEYDFCISIPGGEWNAWIRGLEVARQWINEMADTMGLRVLVIGDIRETDFSSKVKVVKFQPWRQFLEYVNKSKALLCASKHDASPRVLMEALALNVPILVNENILGGWKYVNEVTGDFFCPDEPIGPAVTRFLNKLHLRRFSPRQWLSHNVDPLTAGATLAAALESLSSLSWRNVADGLIFINLASRTDRRQYIVNMLDQAGFERDFCHRLEAIENKDCGHLGCTESHIAALQYALDQGWNRAIIIEDDLELRMPKERALFMLREFICNQPEWDVFMLASYYTNYHNKNVDVGSYFKRLAWGSTTAGYIVNGQTYMRKLLDFWRQGSLALKTEVQQFVAKRQDPNARLQITDHAIDVQWRSLQETDYFFISEPALGQQCGSWSSIMQ